MKDENARRSKSKRVNVEGKLNDKTAFFSMSRPTVLCMPCILRFLWLFLMDSKWYPVVQIISLERVQQRSIGRINDVPRVLEESVEVVDGMVVPFDVEAT